MTRPLVAELHVEELKDILARARLGPLSEPECRKLEAVLETLVYLSDLAEDDQTTLRQLRNLLCRSTSEKTRDVFKDLQPETSSTTNAPESEKPSSTVGTPDSKSHGGKPNGHGRNGASAYAGARKIRIAHAVLKVGDRCPGCQKGKLYDNIKPGMLVRILGQAPIQATVYEVEKLRCNLCNEVFTAETPEEVGPEKYDATAAAMIAMLKYGSGMPFHRLDGLQTSLGIPLPASTQWEIVSETAAAIQPVYDTLIREAADGEVLHNDDTSMRILELMEVEAADPEFGERTGVFTSGIVSTGEGRKIALFFTGRKHAGENLADVLKQRAKALNAPIQMCDALSRNLPKQLEVILSNCIVHARRRFVEVAPNFPEECRHVLEVLGGVYRNDAITRARQMLPDERLRFHQEQSAPLMNGLRDWFDQQLNEHKVEPNSGLGSAMAYMKKHWHALTTFLREPGAPLDNNACERALKKAILHRKNALFYKTQNGARGGDIFMSLISTCQLCGVDPFDYLTELQRHREEIPSNPLRWMPWSYRADFEVAVRATSKN